MSTIKYLLIFSSIILASPLSDKVDKSRFGQASIHSEDERQRYLWSVSDSLPGHKMERNLIELMIVPNQMGYEEIKKKIKEDFFYRSLIHYLSIMLQQEGYGVKDFIETFTINERKYQLQKSIDTDPFDFLIRNAPVEIFIYTDIYIHDFGENEKQINLQLTAKDRYTGALYAATELVSSTRRKWPNTHAPAKEALTRNNSLSSFISQLDQELQYIRTNGRQVDLQIECLEESPILLNQNINNGKNLGAIIADWIKNNSIADSKTKPSFSNKLLRLEVGVPIYQKEKQLYTPLDFGFNLQEFIKTTIKAAEIGNTEIDLKVAEKMIYIYIG